MNKIGPLIFLVLIVAGLCASQAVDHSGLPGFNSQQAFLFSDREVFDANVKLKPLNPDRPSDRIALDLFRRLEKLSGYKCDISWAEGVGAFAHPTVGIVIDRNQLVELQESLGP